MNCPQASDSTRPTSGGDEFAYLDGDWVSRDRMLLSVDDLGFRFGATAVERLRTYHGRVFQLDAHMRRWQHTVETIQISNLPLAAEICDRIHELLQRSEPFVIRQGDVGITMVATPGHIASGRPTFGIHLSRLDHKRIARRRTEGQGIVITDIVQPPESSWSRSIKVRSRLHYYLADLQAHQADADASGLLIDCDDTVTETSISNIAVVTDGTLFSPPDDRVLGGITQQVVERLAAKLSIRWVKRPVDKNTIRGADEILLMGTDTGLWFACRIDGRPVGKGGPGPLYRRLLDAFEVEVTR